MTGFQREVAYRIFANELRNTKVVLERNPDDPYAPQYVLTPTGAKVNRIFVVGTLTEKEDIGTDTENWRLRVADPTGTFIMYAGMYQPDATLSLASISVADVDAPVPEFVAVVGKVGAYITDDGMVRTSVKPEAVSVVDVATRDAWVAETARLTMERVDAVSESPYPELMKEHYPKDTKMYTTMAMNAMADGEST